MKGKRIFFKIADWFLDRKFIDAIRIGLIQMMPVMIVGSTALMFLNLPIDWFQNFMIATFGQQWSDFPLLIYNATFSIMSLSLVVSISYACATDSGLYREKKLNPVIVSMASLGCFVIFSISPADLVLDFTVTGVLGLFKAIVVGMFVPWLYIWYQKRQFFSWNLFSQDADPDMPIVMHSIEPTFFVLLVCTSMQFIFQAFGFSESVVVFLNHCLESLQSFSGFITAICFAMLSHLFWFLGMHGNNLLEPVTSKLFVHAGELNQAAVAAGFAPTEIFTKQFFDVFVFIGGSGAGLALIIALILGTKQSGTNRLAKYSSLFAFFNINELVMYGLPVVLNPVYTLPFLLSPCVLITITYLAMKTGLVPLTVVDVKWTTPIIYGGYAATGGSISGAVLQLINLSVAVGIYYPFVKWGEHWTRKQNEKVKSELFQAIQYIDVTRPMVIINRNDSVGSLARRIAEDIQEGIVKREFYLVYQPKVDKYGRVLGAEALLRWDHPVLGAVPPPVIISIAEEAGLENLLGDWVIEEACRQLNLWNENEFVHLEENFTLSINLSPTQLKDPVLINLLEYMMKKYSLAKNSVELEITENVALDASADTQEALQNIKGLGILLALDDFGMGHGSLTYLRVAEVDCLKIDGALVRDILTDEQTQDIIGAIVSLAQNLGITTVAEMVETKAQSEKIFGLGCDLIQGYYFSKPLPAQDFAQYVNMFAKKENMWMTMGIKEEIE